MKGVIVTSHGALAQGMLETTKLFLGDDLKQIEACCLKPEDNPDEFVNVLKEACERVDTGDGVLVFCDLLFGSPCNCMARILGDNVEVITGMNLPMVLEVMTSREFGDINVENITNTGKEGVADLKKVLGSAE